MQQDNLKNAETTATHTTTASPAPTGRRPPEVEVLAGLPPGGVPLAAATADLRAEGADVRRALAAVDRAHGGHASLAGHGLELRALPTTTELVETTR